SGCIGIDHVRTGKSTRRLHVHFFPSQGNEGTDAHGVLHPHHLAHAANVVFERADQFTILIEHDHADLVQVDVPEHGLVDVRTMHLPDHNVGAHLVDVINDELVDVRVDVGPHLPLHGDDVERRQRFVGYFTLAQP